jgi:hypothetical protein
MANITVSSEIHEFLQTLTDDGARTALALGNSATRNVGTDGSQVASGNHTHAQLHDAATVAGNGINLTGQQISLNIGTGAAQIASGNHSHTTSGSLGIVIDGAGSAITAGVKGYLKIPYNCTITSSEIVAKQTGSIIIDIWRDTYANFPPTDADSITASATPTLFSGQKSQDLTLTNWAASLTGGHYLAFNVDSVTGVTQATLTLNVRRSI